MSIADAPLDRRTLVRGLVAAGVAVTAADVVAAGPAAAQGRPAVPNPTVTGPVPARVRPGDPAHDYPYFASQFDLRGHGYVEEEFFLAGTANTYTVANGQLTTASVVDGGHEYRTRMVVRRPVDPKRFNGTVFVEWYNVTMGFDVEADWFRFHEHIMRAGYAWVGVSAQRVGVDALKAWSPTRYSSLDLTNDAFGFDIYAQALQAIRSPRGVRPLGSLRASKVIAGGESQSASKLTQYYNAIHPLHGLADGFILNGAPEPNLVVRTDLRTPAFKLTTETDVAVIGHAQNRQPDSRVLRTWEVTGTSHADFDMIGEDLSPHAPGINPVQFRDTGTFQDWTTCDKPTLPRTPYKYVYHAALDHLDRWMRRGTPPPHGRPLEVLSTSGPRGATLARDSFGIARGGIRLAAVDVPIALNASPNSPGFFCSIFGNYEPFSPAVLATLYQSHGAYVSRVNRVCDENVRDGYLLAADARTIRNEAARSDIGR
ncbi:alpha/beta hydrolase domain-containing protein [Asanoa sp. NPDC050611]|uniref:alpha/beta hydrolase domain-containing protein n=1 Tax=Asanoa sp. NPDC050611 TaxID=3157098 RepID=UPI0033D40F41